MFNSSVSIAVALLIVGLLVAFVVVKRLRARAAENREEEIRYAADPEPVTLTEAAPEPVVPEPVAEVVPEEEEDFEPVWQDTIFNHDAKERQKLEEAVAEAARLEAEALLEEARREQERVAAEIQAAEEAAPLEFKARDDTPVPDAAVEEMTEVARQVDERAAAQEPPAAFLPADAEIEPPLFQAFVEPVIEVAAGPEPEPAAKSLNQSLREESARLQAEHAARKAVRIEAERAEAAERKRIEDERREAERLVAAEKKRLDDERIEAERIAAAEQQRIDDERRAAEEAARLQAEREEAARMEADLAAAEEAARLESERYAAEIAARLEAERLAAVEAQRKETERLMAEQAARLEAERLETEARVHAEAQRLAEIEAVRLETERLVAIEAARVAAEEAARLEVIRLETERIARIEAERVAREDAVRQQAARLEAEEAARLEAIRFAAAEKVRVEFERVAAEQAAEKEALRLAEAQRLHAKEAGWIEAARAKKEAMPAAPVPVPVVAKTPDPAPPAPPVATLVPEVPPPAQPAGPKAATETIVMIADDSKVVRVKTNRLLMNNQFQVQQAEDGLDAVKQMAERMPDILITDVEMPGLNGFELTRHVRASPLTAHIPVIMISAEESYGPKAAEAGVDILLCKPYADDVMIGHIQRLMRDGRAKAA